MNSKCPKCDNVYFEIVTETPRDSNFKLIFVRCTMCKAVVGTMDFENIGYTVNMLQKSVNQLQNSLMTINTNQKIVFSKIDELLRISKR